MLRFVQTSAVLSGLAPDGLFFLIAVAYAVGAARIAGRGALVQQVDAVEVVSRVDVVYRVLERVLGLPVATVELCSAPSPVDDG